MKAWLVAGVGVLAMSVMLLLSSASPAHAEYKQFCWGKHLPGKGSGEYWCSGAQDYITEVSGSGEQHSVCVTMWIQRSTTMCSGGPLQGVYDFAPNGEAADHPQIENNAPGANTVYGSVDYCIGPCGSP